ncbi:MAG: methyltransferase [Hyphomicrobiales bacterium]|nr:methyltransferase [Hyphomicrobiales bacterium]
MPEEADPEGTAVREDRLLGGRLRLVQLATGHRAGTDAILLIATAGVARHLVDLGSGVGTAGLGLGMLGRAETVTLVERDAGAAALARRNAALNGLGGRVAVVETDITAPARVHASLGLSPGMADLVVSNPPFNRTGQHRASPNRARALAHAMMPDELGHWLKTAARVLAGQGRLAMIHRPEALPWLLPLMAQRFGSFGIRPVHARPDEPARRVLIGAVLGGKAPARLLPALILHQADGRFTPLAERLNNGEAEIAL